MRENHTLRYTLLQIMLWATFGFLFSYANPFLTELLHLSDTLAGLILCSATAAACLLQPALTALCDKRGLSCRRALLVSGCITALCAAMAALPLSVALKAAAFALACVGLQALPSFANALGMEQIRCGKRVNFGLARGIGSASYGVAAKVAPFIKNQFGMNGIALAGCVMVLLLSVIIFAEKEPSVIDKNRPVSWDEQPSGGMEFLRSHKRFCGIILATVLLYIGHNVLSNCMFRIAQSKLTAHMQGNAFDLQGTALLIAALVELPAMFLFTRLVKKVRCDLLLLASSGFMTLRLLLTWLLPGSIGLYIAQLPQSLGYALFCVCSVYYAGSVVEKRNVVKGQTYIGTANTIGCMLAYAAGGVLIDLVGVGNMLLVCLGTSVVGCLLTFFSMERVDKTVGAE